MVEVIYVTPFLPVRCNHFLKLAGNLGDMTGWAAAISLAGGSSQIGQTLLKNPGMLRGSSESGPMYGIIVADDQELYRAGIIALLESSGECRVVAECCDWIGLVEAVTAGTSLVVASTRLAADPEWLMARTRRARSRVLLLCEDSDALSCYRATGAAGALHRSATAPVFLDTLRKSLKGDSFVLPSDGSPTLQFVPRLAKNLSPRELKILELLMEGSKNRRIAEHLDIAEHVVRSAFQKIFDKTGFSNRLELALFLSNCR
jgi:DNA-binding NarL/FixJ family response regulator